MTTVKVGGVETYKVVSYGGRVNLQDLDHNMVTNMSVPEARALADALNDPMVQAIAVSLYMYNVNSASRAEKLWVHFDGACADPDELQRMVDSPYWATEMAFPTAARYLYDAIEHYGSESWSRVEANRGH